MEIARNTYLNSNIVIYMVNPSREAYALPHMCAAFWKLFESYSFALQMRQVSTPSDIVLQTVPLDFVASSSTLVLPPPIFYKRLAFEVYDRCPPDRHVGPSRLSSFSFAPSIHLTKTLPKTINFKLSADAPVGLLKSDCCFHLAYSWIATQQWLIASWTDNQGELQWNAPYCLAVSKNEELWPALHEIFKEIWDTTLEILHPKTSVWRLFILKTGQLYQKELDCRLALSTIFKETSLTLLTFM